jgi:hypothetical protein
MDWIMSIGLIVVGLVWFYFTGINAVKNDEWI